MATNDFRTKTMMIRRTNISTPGVWPVAIDVGYSGVKIFSPNVIACFPAFAVPVKGQLLDLHVESSDDTILYRDDKDSKIWLVGKAAQDSVSKNDPDTATMSIYGRNRYFSDMFRIISNVALGIACTKSYFGDPGDLPVVLRTGLPNEYIESDNVYIKEAFEGLHSFDMKIGDDKWEHYDIVIGKGEVSVMPQPMGTLLSVATGNDGKLRAEANLYYTSPTLVCDPGFGTFDCFGLNGKDVRGQDTFEAFGMKQVLADVSEEIFKKYHVEIPVPAMQSYLEKGTVVVYDRKNRTSIEVPFGDILEKHSADVAKKAIDNLDNMYDLGEYKYLILTGGTGEAWYPYFKEAFKGMQTLTIIPGNQNTMGIVTDKDGHPAPLPFIFSNVRGYYMALCHK